MIFLANTKFSTKVYIMVFFFFVFFFLLWIEKPYLDLCCTVSLTEDEVDVSAGFLVLEDFQFLVLVFSRI